MADVGDVANALVNLISAALYPNGTSSPSTVGCTVAVYRGHPGAKKLEDDMQAGYTLANGMWNLTAPTSRIVHACVNVQTGVGRMVRPYVFGGVQQTGTAPTQTLTVAVSGDTVTIGGTIGTGLGVAVAANGFLAGATAGSTDTLASLATEVAAALTTAGIAATASGPVVTVAGATTLLANTFVQIGTGQEVKRKTQGFDITLYVPARDLRDTVSSAIDSQLGLVDRFTLPDQFQARMWPSPPIELDDDKPEKALLFVRKLFYSVEYATVVTGQASTLALAQAAIADIYGNAIATYVEA